MFVGLNLLVCLHEDYLWSEGKYPVLEGVEFAGGEDADIPTLTP